MMDHTKTIISNLMEEFISQANMNSFLIFFCYLLIFFLKLTFEKIISRIFRSNIFSSRDLGLAAFKKYQQTTKAAKSVTVMLIVFAFLQICRLKSKKIKLHVSAACAVIL